MKTRNLLNEARITVLESIRLTAESLRAYGPSHDFWSIAWSGGKDSTTLLTVVLHLIHSGAVTAPKALFVLYADTRMELPPLSIAAMRIIEQLRGLGIHVQIVLPDLDKRFFVYMLGRGIPPPNNQTFRWCTEAIKVKPMEQALRRMVEHLGKKVLVLTGVRQGESAIRDDRIAMSCGRNGAECGQGWYQETLPESLCDTLAPILHWRVCNVWEWLRLFAPSSRYGGWDTQILADAYGGEEAEEVNARTGCNGCPLANHDTALDSILKVPQWQYLTPLKELRPLYRELREHQNRLRQPGGERRKDGSLVSSQNRIGPLTMEARRNGLAKVIDIQNRINVEGVKQGRPAFDHLNPEENSRIVELIESNTWPEKWTGEEPRADLPYDAWDASGNIARTLFGQ